MEAILENPATWVALSFVIFLFGFMRLAVPHITKGLDDRSANIRSELDEAIRLKEEAQALLADYKQKQKEALVDAEAIIKQAETEAASMQKQAEATLTASVERRTQMAHDRIARAEASVLSDIQSMMVATSTKAAEQLITEKLDNKQQGKLITQALGDAKQLVH